MTTIQSPPSSEDHNAEPSKTAAPKRTVRRSWTLWAALAVIAAIVVAIVVVLNDGDSSTPAASSVAPLELDAGAGDAMASCMPLDPAILAPMAPAFAATVTAVDGEAVTLQVDRWYAGDTGADTVLLHAPAGMEALIGGIAFEAGQQYLITATDGVVNYCGFSGPATPELQAAFDTAFGG